MTHYPRRVNVTTIYDAKRMVWHAMLDDDRDLIGGGQEEADAVYELYVLIHERELDQEGDEERYQAETGMRS